jgi:[acyl-carrier-protein] S-malonyltransferase
MEFTTKLACVFAGQGAQHQGMASELYAQYAQVRTLFELASDVCKKDMKKLLFEAEESVLKETMNTQPAVTLASLAGLVAMRSQGIGSEQLAFVAGFSLGEYAALAAAEVITFEETFALVTERGKIMHHAGNEYKKHAGEAGMAAVVGLSSGEVKAILNDQNEVFVANYNAPDQVVISGLLSQIERLEPLLREHGAKRVIKLAVSGPFHTQLLAGASLEFKACVTQMRFANPKMPLYSNVTGGILQSAAEIQQHLSEQISHPVLWQAIVADAYMRFAERVVVEVGPGNVLSSLMRSNGCRYEMHSCMTVKAIESLVQRLG